MSDEIKTAGDFEQAAKEAEQKGDLQKAAECYERAASVSLGRGRAERYRKKAQE